MKDFLNFKRNGNIVSLSIGSSGLSLIQAERRSGAWRLLLAAHCALPGGDNDAAGTLTGLMASSGAKKGEISLSLGDEFAKVALLDFKELPQRKKEADALIKWKASRDLFVKAEEYTVGYQAFPLERGVKVVAVAVKTATIRAYEDALSNLGFAVRKISIQSFDLLNAFFLRLKDELDFAVVAKTRNSFSVLFFENGAPSFYRCKEASSEADTLAQLGATFAYYTDKYPDKTVGRVYLVSETDDLVEASKGAAGAPVSLLAPDEALTSVASQEHAGRRLAILAALGAAI